MFRIRAIISCTLLGLLLAVGLSGAPVLAAGITVDDDCPLSAAIESANRDLAQGRCTSGSGADTITLTSDITLTGEALPRITADLTINGDDNSLSGGDLSAIFWVENADVTIRNLTISNGFSSTSGGAIFVDGGNLILEDSSVENNEALNSGGGIYANGARVTLIRSFVRNNVADSGTGGGIYIAGKSDNEHRLTIDESVFYNNRASQDGGAIHATGGAVEIKKSGFQDNGADEGGVIEIWNGTLVMHNTTLHNNSAREGGAVNAGADPDSTGSVALVHNTFTSNTAWERGGSIAMTGLTATLDIGNTWMSGQLADGVLHCDSGISPYSILENSANYIQDESCPDLSNIDPQALSIDQTEETVAAQSVEAQPAEAQSVEEGLELVALSLEEELEQLKLSSLRDIEGVIYHELLQGNPAIDAADNELCRELDDPDDDVVDTRRPQGAACDIGAWELPLPTPTPTPRPPDPLPPAPTNPPPLPTATATPTPLPVCEPVYEHVVAAGDNLFRLAIQYGITVEALIELNQLPSDAILSVGQVIEVPYHSESPENPCICPGVPAGYLVRTSSHDVRCLPVEIADIDKHPLMNAGVVQALSIFGNAAAGVEFCFSGAGTVVFEDDSTFPAQVSRLSLYENENLRCAQVPGQGRVVHVAALTDAESIPLIDCQVTTSNVARLVDRPAGNTVLGILPFNITMSASARTANWLLVNYLGRSGWISASLAQTTGACD
ncbi:MAG: LysM peptidoglycan-binding domain-containing protein [Chloroflexi bacterium]|nr:LysM peptidoglycan-binding domain-containing protein [Chloroflexota bacterium]MCY3582251.1 LysM peptidoglycan-binding domain-containing protein [Chloroflexota bacterium]MCY3715009.1 LysM peptidoglycan-binding domain-containing protein [Chloroflexota bacterium]MDE2650535.1 LysM peptidoglycan-binding domain-containing protein [Chloroflexota bacterium]MXV92917.1 LysM peptidoglycan-binding domain-containing protein [Chloroflexota bacterium]